MAHQVSGPAGAARTAKPGRSTNVWVMVLGTLAVLALVGVGVIAGTIVFGGSPGKSPTKATHDISSQQTDPAPLSTAELFPATSVRVGGVSYPVVKAQASADCKTGAAGDLATLLGTAGCTQVVRAALVSPDKTYALTVGLFNLKDTVAAGQVNGSVKSTIDAQKGRFTGYAADPVTDIFQTAATQLGWDTDGHFLAYAVIARSDGKAVDGTVVQSILNGFVEDYLRGTVLDARIKGKAPSASASAAPSH